MDISKIEHVAANALPSPIVQWHQGWRFRYAYGVTRRANSVLAESHVGNLAEKLQAVEDFYASYNAPLAFRFVLLHNPQP